MLTIIRSYYLLGNFKSSEDDTNRIEVKKKFDYAFTA